ncbi:MAG: MBOAT family protein [Dysgonamonadaceae bacterium]|jgi:D-alanyl-lipoteichoic acid acyltransferase DltB (MBOAT superfamily)|nr:MBOAT family protein [Dysgonamonadaceae bacterium]
MNWNPLYGLLILFSTIVTWLCALFLNQKEKREKKKIILFCALILNLGILVLFKYADFITLNINDLFQTFHIKWEVPFLDLLLPVGISFYTFQAIGYTIDVYKGTISAEKNFITYALFISFFPQLVAGPIERAKNLLPQFHRTHHFDTANFVQGARLILWGYFMKIVVSDRLAIYVNFAYGNISYHNTITLIVATIFFAFQIYCDFGGYSNIAIGCAKIMGFDLMANFKRPYLSTSAIEFWRRWHISLSTWFRDYVYIPLGGNRCSKGRNYLNIFITFTISGLWHGANWTFIVWGALNGIFQIIEKFTAGFRKKWADFFCLSKIPIVVYGFNVLFTFTIITITWVFFRAGSMNIALQIFDKLLNVHRGPLFTLPLQALLYGSCFTLVLIVSDFLQERNGDKHFFLENKSALVRYVTYLSLVIIILLFGVFDSSRFIYFQF